MPQDGMLLVRPNKISSPSDPGEWSGRNWGSNWRRNCWRGNDRWRSVVNSASDCRRVLAGVVVVVAAGQVAGAGNWQQLGEGAANERGQHEHNDELGCHFAVVFVCLLGIGVAKGR